MRYPVCVMLILIFIKGPAYNQTIVYPSVVPKNATAAQFSPQVANVFVSCANPAVIVSPNGLMAGFMAEKKYLSKELSTIYVSVGQTSGESSITLSATHFGNAFYSEKRAAISLGRRLGDINLGIQLGYYSMKIDGQKIISGIESGIFSVWKLHPNVYSSIRMHNPQALFIKNKNPLQLTAAFAGGLGYQASDNLYFGFEAEKEQDRSATTIFFMRFDISKVYILKGSWNTGTHQPRISIAWRIRRVQVESAIEYHPVLGISPALLFLFNTKSREK